MTSEYEIAYDRGVREYRIMVNGQLAGFAPNMHVGELAILRLLMDREQAIAHLRRSYPHETVDLYVTEAEHLLGASYWSSIDSEADLSQDMDRFIEALEALNVRSNRD